MPLTPFETRFLENQPALRFHQLISLWKTYRRIPPLQSLASQTSGLPLLIFLNGEGVIPAVHTPHAPKNALVFSDAKSLGMFLENKTRPDLWKAPDSLEDYYADVHPLVKSMGKLKGSLTLVTNLTPASLFEILPGPFVRLDIEDPSVEGIERLGILKNRVTVTEKNFWEIVRKTLQCEAPASEKTPANKSVPERLSLSSLEIGEIAEIRDTGEANLEDVEEGAKKECIEKLEDMLDLFCRWIEELTRFWYHNPAGYTEAAPMEKKYGDFFADLFQRVEDLRKPLPAFAAHILACDDRALHWGLTECQKQEKQFHRINNSVEAYLSWLEGLVQRTKQLQWGLHQLSPTGTSTRLSTMPTMP